MPTPFFTALPPAPRLLMALLAAARLTHFRAIPADRLPLAALAAQVSTNFTRLFG